MFLECPAYMDNHGESRCGLPAEIEHRYSVSSTDGVLESAKIRCPRGHWFNGPLDSLTWGKSRDGALTGAGTIRASLSELPGLGPPAPPAFRDQGEAAGGKLAEPRHPCRNDATVCRLLTDD